MTQITIVAQVVNGRLQHEESLAEFEGQHFLVTVRLSTDAQRADTQGSPST